MKVSFPPIPDRNTLKWNRGHIYQANSVTFFFITYVYIIYMKYILAIFDKVVSSSIVWTRWKSFFFTLYPTMVCINDPVQLVMRLLIAQ